MDGTYTTDVLPSVSDYTISSVLNSSENFETVYRSTLSFEVIQTTAGLTGKLNNNTSHVEYLYPISLAGCILGVIILSIIWALSFWGNLLLWMVVFRRKSLRTVTNAMVLCLSFADLLVSIVNLPITIVTVAIGEKWMFGETVCVLLGFLNMLTFIASVMSLAAIGMCRYLFICHPEKFRRVYSRQNTGFIIAGVWLFSGLLASPPLYGWAEYDYLPGQSFCFCDWKTSVSYTFFMVGVCFGGPCSIMTFCYMQILRVVRNSRRRVNSTIKKQSTTPSTSKLQTPPVLDKVHSTDKNFKGSQINCNSITISVTSNTGVSIQSGGESAEIVASTITENVQQTNNEDTNSNLLQIPQTKLKRYLNATNQSTDKKSSVEHDFIKTNTGHQSVGLSAENMSTYPYIPTIVTPSTSGDSDFVEENIIQNGTKNTTSDSLSRRSVSVVEDRSSFISRLSQHGSIMKSMISTRTIRQKNTANDRSRRRRQEELKLTKSFAVVILVFIICWMPFCIAMFWSVFGEHPPPRMFDMATLILGYFNSCCNPIIYGIMNNKFRAGYKDILCKVCSCTDKRLSNGNASLDVNARTT